MGECYNKVGDIISAIEEAEMEKLDDEMLSIGAEVADAEERVQERRLKEIEESADIVNMLDSPETLYGYSYVSRFEYGLARIRQGSKWGLINEEGEIVLPIKYDVIWKFEGKHRATTRVELNGKIEEIRLCDYSDKAPIPYWEKKKHYQNNSYDEDYSMDDLIRESWYAMTDGMYGDMPDGCDGDYEWLGY